ncbi:hypothetical protein P4S64_03715 [Vibrio sp. M60_M31a]
MITHGQGSGVVVATGIDTELGKISSLVSRVKPTTTPLLKQNCSVQSPFNRWDF